MSDNAEVEIHRIILEIYTRIREIERLGDHDGFTSAVRDTEKRLFTHAKGEATRQRKDHTLETDYIISGLSALVKRLRNHKTNVGRIMGATEKTTLKKLNRQCAETRSLSDEVRRIFEADAVS